ncbi:MAG: hypothetical protein KDJ38_05390, partial [Gammaproteobacteria bacterium]|nr:hypothetical protein [Gammaproteobacteria bacterium]
TQSLSANGFTSSFVAFYSFFIYAMMLDPIEPFVFFTRLAASLMTLTVLYEIYRDRTALSDKAPFLISTAAMVLSVVLLVLREDVMAFIRPASTILVVVSSLVMLQGGVSQIIKIVKSRTTGALSFAMTLIFFAKDVSNVLFGLVLGLVDGWPLVLIGGVSGLMKLIILGLFVKEIWLKACLKSLYLLRCP